MFTLVTAIAGAIVAIRLAPLLMELVDDSTAKIAIGIACVIVGVGIGEVAGSTVGRAISKRISWRPAQAVDRTLGLFGYADRRAAGHLADRGPAGLRALTRGCRRRSAARRCSARSTR